MRGIELTYDKRAVGTMGNDSEVLYCQDIEITDTDLVLRGITDEDGEYTSGQMAVNRSTLVKWYEWDASEEQAE